MNNPEDFKHFVEFYDWLELWPELSLAVGAVLLLLVDLFRKPTSGSALTGNLATGFQALLLGDHLLDYLVLHTEDYIARDTFSDMLSQNIRGEIMRSFFLLASLLVSVIAHNYLRRKRLPSGEFHHLSMLATAGLMLLVQSSHFVMMIVALEAVAICLYVLVGFRRESGKSLEAGFKYLVFGALSSSLLLFGIVLLYGVSANPESWGCEPVADFSDPFSFAY